MAEVDEEEGAQPSPQTKKVPKKKHYPFGTPSHLHHPYSEFSHLKDTDKSFGNQFILNQETKYLLFLHFSH
jgi:hypothetical protein